MTKRFISLWFRHLKTDWFTLRRPALKNVPFVLGTLDRGRMLITAVNAPAERNDVEVGMVLADARIGLPGLEVRNDPSGLADKLLHALALWCIRYTPIVAADPPNGLILDVSGCAHLWGGERPYFKDIVLKLRGNGYDVRGAMADTIGAAWAWARFGKITPILDEGAHREALLRLPPMALRLDAKALARLIKFDFQTIEHIVQQPRSSLPQRFGKQLILRIDQAFGKEEENIIPVRPPEPYQERLPCLEPIRSAGGIEIALTRLLEMLCRRLQQEGKGLRSAVFTGYRIDGKVEKVQVGTTRATYNINHLFKLFEGKIPSIEPALGIDVFQLDATKIEDVSPLQEALWGGTSGIDSISLAELLDRLANKNGLDTIHRYLPAEHYWPERSITLAPALRDKPSTLWKNGRPRPILVLPIPVPIKVTAPIPDFPPMNFRYRGKFHKVRRADGPEHIKNEWWIDKDRHRHYYAVENEGGERYWLFRAGHYGSDQPVQWFLHGFFP